VRAERVAHHLAGKHLPADAPADYFFRHAAGNLLQSQDGNGLWEKVTAIKIM